MELNMLNYFDQLASVIATIDESKYASNNKVIPLIDQGMQLIRRMKLEKIETGNLQDILVSICVYHDQPFHLPYLIEMAHEEIENQLGNDAWKIYCRDESLAA